MKLIYITNARIPTEKAHGLQIMKMCEAFVNANNANGGANIANKIDVELIVPWRFNSISHDPFEYYGVKKNFKIRKIFCVDLFPVKFIPKKISFYLQSFSFSKLAVLYAFIKHGRNGNIFYSRDYITLFFLCVLGLKPVAEIHDYRATKPRWPFEIITRKSRKIIVNSEGTKKFLREHYGISDKKFLVAPNGVDVDFFNIKETREEARKVFDMPLDKVIVGYAGRLETVGKEKGVRSLIEAFGLLFQRQKGIILYVAGGPESLTNAYRSALKPAGLDSNVVVFYGQVEYKKIPLFFRALDIAVITSPAEKQYSATMSPIKLFELMAAGKAIVAPDLPGVEAALKKDECVFFQAGSSNDLAEKISYLAERPDLVEKLAHNVLLKSKEYAWDKRAGKILNFINSTLF
jgi:glycosyltransferase involved in cell wall biosynthesis